MSEVIFKRGLKENLPASAADGTLLFTTDTGEVFMGKGEGQDLLRFSNIEIYDTEEDLPGTGEQHRLYVTRQGDLFCWDGEYRKLEAEMDPDSLPDYLGEGDPGQILVKLEDFVNYQESEVDTTTIKYNVDISPDETLVAACSDGTGRTFDVHEIIDGEIQNDYEVGDGAAPNDLKFSPDGSIVAVVTGDDELKIHKKDGVDDWSLLSTHGFDASVNGLDFCPEGQYIAVAHGENGGGVTVLELQEDDSLEVVDEKSLEDEGESCVFTNDGSYVLAGSRPNGSVIEIFQFDGESLEEAFTYELGGGDLDNMDICNNDRFVAAGSSLTGYHFNLLELDKEEPSEMLSFWAGKNFSGPNGVAISPDGRYMATAYSSSMSLMERDDEEEELDVILEYTTEEICRDVAISKKTGNYLALTDHNNVVVLLAMGTEFGWDDARAENIKFDDSNVDFEAENVQAAIDELAAMI